MTAFSVEPQQLTTAAERFGALAVGVTGEPALGYRVHPEQLGGQPLAAAVDSFQRACADALSVLTADLTATDGHLRATAQRYVRTDNAVAAAISAH